MLISRISMMAGRIVSVCALMAIGSLAWAQTDDEATCSNRSLRGDYGFAATGVLVGTPGLPKAAPFRSVGVTSFDGKGNLTWTEHTVINGVSLELNWTAASGSYHVNPNCTGTAVVNTPNSPVPLDLFFVVVKEGKEIHSVLNANAIATVFIKVE